MDDSQITDTRARSFAGALQAFEADADPASLTPLFADGATVLRLDARGERTDVEQFWREYRDQFTDISTTFTHPVQGDGACVLEWDSEARLANGRPVEYRGVTVLEFDGDAISRLRTYYDSAAFVAIPASAAAGEGSNR
jgi:ketosteroid isomerase-like protein